ncbi:MAG TPA: hypothetical protein VFC07_01810 [Verrucomicrobiae bacterium]|nr:hypothetical protein [Verrucomicrobiae bacterium]
MRITTTIMLMSVFFCGCSFKHSTPPGSPLDRVQAGRDISFGNYVLHVEKRVGSSLEGIKIVSKGPDGQTVTTVAEKGTISQGSDKSYIIAVLHDAHTDTALQQMSVSEFTINLPVTRQ